MTTEDKVSATVCFGGTGLPLVEPDQTCEACGTLGTVGRVVLTVRGRTEQEIHRFCESCWPEESARYDARWKHHHLNMLDELFEVDSDAVGEQTGNRSRDQDALMVGIGFESATWHGTAEYVERFVELLQMVRSGSVPTLAELMEAGVEMAHEIESSMGERVGKMPFRVMHFLQEFGADSDAANAVRSSTTPADAGRSSSTTRASSAAEAQRAARSAAADSARELNADIAAAHASADAAIAEFDKALESLAIPATPESRDLIERELVEILQQLEQEIATEAAALETWQSEMKAAAKSGDAYTAMKLARSGDDRVLRLNGLRLTMGDVEEIHARFLNEPRTGDA
ncbi:MAG: hypothetical protein ABI852_07685 [Gemmatimonadaceae bacterium]